MMRLRLTFAALLLGAGMCLTPAYASVSDAVRDAAKDAAARTREVDKPPAPGKPPQGGPDDLVTCKRDAADMHGPERSRYMTECIRKR